MPEKAEGGKGVLPFDHPTRESMPGRAVRYLAGDGEWGGRFSGEARRSFNRWRRDFIAWIERPENPGSCTKMRA
jgi:hypothetical protein